MSLVVLLCLVGLKTDAAERQRICVDSSIIIAFSLISTIVFNKAAGSTLSGLWSVNRSIDARRWCYIIFCDLHC